MVDFHLEFVDYEQLSKEELEAIASDVPVDYNLLGIPKELVDTIGGYERPEMRAGREAPAPNWETWRMALFTAGLMLMVIGAKLLGWF